MVKLTKDINVRELNLVQNFFFFIIDVRKCKLNLKQIFYTRFGSTSRELGQLYEQKLKDA